MPYAGRFKAARNTPNTVRNIITKKLAEKTPDPQVEVRRIAGYDATVSLMGSIGAQGIYPIERPTRTLSARITTAGGVKIPPEVAQITLTRGKKKGKICMSGQSWISQRALVIGF